MDITKQRERIIHKFKEDYKILTNNPNAEIFKNIKFLDDVDLPYKGNVPCTNHSSFGYIDYFVSIDTNEIYGIWFFDNMHHYIILDTTNNIVISTYHIQSIYRQYILKFILSNKNKVGLEKMYLFNRLDPRCLLGPTICNSYNDLCVYILLEKVVSYGIYVMQYKYETPAHNSHILRLGDRKKSPFDICFSFNEDIRYIHNKITKLKYIPHKTNIYSPFETEITKYLTLTTHESGLKQYIREDIVYHENNIQPIIV
jgi:hypothetical protein